MWLNGKTALVTRASSGIGEAVTEALRQEGATVVAADIHGDASIRLDVASESNWHRVMECLPQLDIFVSGAGISQAGSIAQPSLEDWRRMNAVTLDGAFPGVRAAAAKMRSGGSIVLMSLFFRSQSCCRRCRLGRSGQRRPGNAFASSNGIPRGNSADGTLSGFR